MDVDLSEPWHRAGPVFGDPRLAPYRLGQGSFKAVILDAYHRRCAISGTHIPPVLEAAHIRPVAKGGEHRLDNGLLLRSDIHTLFDRGYLGVDPSYRLHVSPRLRADFSNGDQFTPRQGRSSNCPSAAQTGLTASFSNGSSTRSSKHDPAKRLAPRTPRFSSGCSLRSGQPVTAGALPGRRFR